MQKLVIVVLLAVFAGCLARPALPDKENTSSTIGVPYNEEIIVESSLNIRKKGETRQKRQFGGFGPYGQSSSMANANAYGQYQGPGGFGANSAMAGAQGFQSQGPQGGFGASATNAGTQGFHAGPGGISGGAGMSGTQTYNLPGGRTANLAYGNTFNSANGVPSSSNTNSLSFS